MITALDRELASLGIVPIGGADMMRIILVLGLVGCGGLELDQGNHRSPAPVQDDRDVSICAPPAVQGMDGAPCMSGETRCDGNADIQYCDNTGHFTFARSRFIGCAEGTLCADCTGASEQHAVCVPR